MRDLRVSLLFEYSGEEHGVLDDENRCLEVGEECEERMITVLVSCLKCLKGGVK